MGGRWSRLTTREGLKSNSVAHVTETDDGAIWIAYGEPFGLSRLTGPDTARRVEHFAASDGLPSDQVVFLGLDHQRRLWVGTDNGAAFRSDGSWTTYTQEDGLVANNCATNAFWADADGSVWIGTLSGLARFRPKPLAGPEIAPRILISTASLGKQPASLTGTTEVPYTAGDFVVTYSAVTFLNESRRHYRWRLVGLDDKWLESRLAGIRYPRSAARRVSPGGASSQRAGALECGAGHRQFPDRSHRGGLRPGSGCSAR